MMKDITWGQYHSVDSMIHRLDPRVKIRFTIVYIILLLLDRNLPLFLFLTAVFAVVWACSRVPIRKMIRGTKGVFSFILQRAECIYRAWNDAGKAWRAYNHEGGTDQSGIRVLAYVAVDSDVKSVDVYDDTDETDGRHGEMHASKWWRGNGNHDCTAVCTDLIWRVRPDHEGADGKRGGLQKGQSGRALEETTDSDIAAFPECNLACRTSGRCNGQPLLYGWQRTDKAASTCV